MVQTVIRSSEIWFIRSNKVSNVSVFCAQLKCINYINHTLGLPRLDINYLKYADFFVRKSEIFHWILFRKLHAHIFKKKKNNEMLDEYTMFK